MSQTSMFDAAGGAPPPVPPVAETAHKLRTTLKRASDAYYNSGEAIMSDAEFDALQRQLAELELAHPELRSADSPTQVIGAPVRPGRAGRHRHLARMLSLPNAMNGADLSDFAARAQRYLDRSDTVGPFTVELKFDGLSLCLTYQNGRFVRATTRGDGEEGEDVTLRAQQMPSIPKELPLSGDWTPSLLEVRGEVVLPFAAFDELNEALGAEGEDGYDNPRNAATGILRDEDPTSTAASALEFFAYGLQISPEEHLPLGEHSSAISQLSRWGFSVSPTFARVETIDDAEALCQRIFRERATLPFMIDGVVVKIDSLRLQDALGAAGKNPRWAVARKEKGETAVTRLLDIDLRPGRTGALTPRAILDPVEIPSTTGHVTVSRATLHNQDEIERLDIRLGDYVELERRGDVIPKVVRVLYERRNGSERLWSFPTACPSCGGPVERPVASVKKGKDGAADEVIYAAATYCDNASCPDQLVRRIEHFASRPALEIRTLGPEVAQQLADARLVSNVADLYALTHEQLLTLDGFGPLKAQNLLNAIGSSRQRPFHRVLIGLGIRHVGKTASQLLTQRFGSIDALLAATPESLEEIEGIGATIARAWCDWAGQDANQALLGRLRSAGLQMVDRSEPPPPAAADSEFIGKTVVITGTHPYKRSRIEGWLQAAGAKTTGSITAKTDYLIAGDKAGSKLDKAQKLGVTILSWDDTVPLLGSALPNPLPPHD